MNEWFYRSEYKLKDIVVSNLAKMEGEPVLGYVSGIIMRTTGVLYEITWADHTESVVEEWMLDGTTEPKRTDKEQ